MIRGGTRPATVVVYPRESNPYQSLLYAALQDLSAAQRDGLTYDVVSVAAPRGTRQVLMHPFVASFRLIATAATSRTRILHIHWMYAFRLPGDSALSRRVSYLNSTAFLSLAAWLRYRIVWTVHNVLPHQQITSNDVAIRRKLARIADAVIVHSASTVPALNAVGVTISDPTVIAHPAYTGHYPQTATRAEARNTLGIPVDAHVCLFFGRIEPYKNVPILLEAFAAIAKANPNAYLVIAGACKDPALRSAIAAAANGTLHTIAVVRRISDDEVGQFFAAADVVVCPFRDITTSGSALLALSLGVPIVAPRIGALADIPDDVGFFYDPATDSALSVALSTALSSPAEVSAAAQKAAEFAAAMTWEKAAAATATVYRAITPR